MADATYYLIEWDGRTGSNALVLPDLDLPGAQPGRVLSGNGVVQATIPLDDRLFDERGDLIVHPYRSGVVVELTGRATPAGRIFETYFVSKPPERDEDSLKVELTSVTGFLDQQPYRDVRWFNMDDCAHVYRHLWTHHQSYPRFNMGVTVDLAYKARERIGFIPRTKTQSAIRAEQRYAAAKKAEESALKVRQNLEAKARADQKVDIAQSRAAADKAKATKDAAFKAYRDAAKRKPPASKATLAQLKATYDTTAKAYTAALARLKTDTIGAGVVMGRAIEDAHRVYKRFQQATSAAYVDKMKMEATVKAQIARNEAYNKKMGEEGWAEYRLAFFDDVDLGQRAVELAQVGRFDFYPVHEWVGDSIRSRIVLVDDDAMVENPGRFVVGENVVVDPTVTEPAGTFATDVWMNGAGEGSSTLHAVSARDADGPGLGRWAKSSDKRVTSTKVLQARVDEAAAAGRHGRHVSEVVCIDHENAPHGSVQLGDWIYVVGDGHGFNALIDQWCRVTGITWDPRADLMHYQVVTS